MLLDQSIQIPSLWLYFLLLKEILLKGISSKGTACYCIRENLNFPNYAI